MERKEGDQASMLAPPSDLLRQFILLRKAVATRTIEAIRQAYGQVKTATYPFQFQHTDAIPYLAVHPPSTLAIQEQAVRMPFMLWDKRTSRPGLLSPADRWFTEKSLVDELVFEPEAIYRGITFATALLAITLTCKAPVNAILQITADHDAKTQRFLLPQQTGPGPRHQPIPLGLRESQLLEEMQQLLVSSYGEVPCVTPSFSPRRMDKRLPAQRYLFQWASEGISPSDGQVLTRFLFHHAVQAGAKTHAPPLDLNALRFGNAPSLKERGDELLRVFGFNHAIMTHLKPSSLDVYCRSFYASCQFAGTREHAFQAETMRNWINTLTDCSRENRFEPAPVKHMVIAVQRILASAAAQGYIPKETAAAISAVRCG